MSNPFTNFLSGVVGGIFDGGPNLKDYQHKMTKKFNGKIAFLNRIIKTNNIYTKYLTTKEEMSMEIENHINFKFNFLLLSTYTN